MLALVEIPRRSHHRDRVQRHWGRAILVVVHPQVEVDHHVGIGVVNHLQLEGRWYSRLKYFSRFDALP